MNELFRAIYEAFAESPIWLLVTPIPFIIFQLLTGDET